MSDTEKTSDENGVESSGGGSEHSTPAGGGAATTGNGISPKNWAFIIYGLFAAGLIGSWAFVPIVAPIAGVILCYMKREEMAGLWLESHFVWLIRTFWISVIAAGVFILLAVVTLGIFAIIGWPLGIALAVWYVYRLVKGFLAALEEKPIANPEAYI